MLSFSKFYRVDVQSQLFAALAPLGEKSGQLDLNSRRRRLQPFRVIPEGHGVKFTLDEPGVACLDLFRTVPNHAFRHRHAGGGVAQGLALDQDAGKLDAIQLSLDLVRSLFGSRSRGDLLFLSVGQHRARLLFLHHRRRRRHGALHLDGQVA